MFDKNLISKMERQREVNLQIRKLEFCYKIYKFLRKEIDNPDCPFEFKEWITEKCRNCKWYGEEILEIKEEK